MTELEYEVTGPVARLTLNRPARGNGLTRGLIGELERRVEQADLDPTVRVLLLAGHGKGFCGGYDLVDSAEGRAGRGRGRGRPRPAVPRWIPRSWPPTTIQRVWDPMVDYAMMSRNVRAS